MATYTEFPPVFVDLTKGVSFLVVHKDCPGIKEFALKIHMGILKPFGWNIEFHKQYAIHHKDPNALLIPIQKDGMSEVQIDCGDNFIFVAHGMANWRKPHEE